MDTRFPVVLLLSVSLVLVGVAPVAAASHGDQTEPVGTGVEAVLSDNETVDQAVSQYNTVIPQYRDEVPDSVRSQLENTTVNVKVSGEEQYNYSARVTDDLTVTEFDTAHRDDATLYILTDVDTLNQIAYSSEPGQTARQAWQDGDIRIETTANSSTGERAVVTGTDFVRTVADESEQAIETAREAIDTVVRLVDELGQLY